MKTDPDFRQSYLELKQVGFSLWADTMVEEAETELGSTSMAAVQARRNVLDTKKWLLSKLVPNEFGDRVDHRHAHLDARVTISLPAKGSYSAADPGCQRPAPRSATQ